MKHRNPLSTRFLIAATFLLGLLGLSTAAVLSQGSGSKSDRVASVEVKAEINAQGLKALLDSGVPLALLDTRGRAAQWIAGAKMLAHDADQRTIRRILGSTRQLVVTYCSGPGCDTSLKLANRLAGLGFSNVIRFTGGIEAWKAAGFPVEGASLGRYQGSGTR